MHGVYALAFFSLVLHFLSFWSLWRVSRIALLGSSIVVVVFCVDMFVRFWLFVLFVSSLITPDYSIWVSE
jgi:hypothetical protein